MNKKKEAVNHSCYPDEVIERLARCFYPAILESFNNEEDQKAFAAWQAEQARCSAKEKQDVPDGERPDIHTQLFSSWVRPSGRTLFDRLQKNKTIKFREKTAYSKKRHVLLREKDRHQEQNWKSGGQVFLVLISSNFFHRSPHFLHTPDDKDPEAE